MLYNASVIEAKFNLVEMLKNQMRFESKRCIMKKKSRIVLCGIMTLIMAFVMAMPVSVSAAVSDDDVAKIGDTGYATLAEAVAAVEENGSGEIIILKNIENC